MAAIGNIRKHSTFLVIVIGIALAAFVLGDFAKGGGGSRNVNVGEIEGEEVTIMDFNFEAEKNIEATMQQQKKDRLSTDETFSVKEQTWNDIVHRIIMDNEYEALGLTVSSDELFDLVQGPNPHALIKQYFTDPNTQQYDRNMVVQYLQNMESLPDEAKLQWVRFEKYIKDDRLRTKFNTLVAQGYYVPKDLARVIYNEKNDKADIDYVAAKFIDIKDSLFSPTDDDYAEYYDNNKEQYKEKASRDIEYVVFNIVPSAKDVEDAAREMDQIALELKETVDVLRFVKVNSDNPYDSSWFAAGQLPVQIDSLMFNSEVGTVSNAYMLNSEFHAARLMEVGQRPDSMKASHILIAYVGAYNARPEVVLNRDQAKILTDSLFKVLERNPSKMVSLAQKFSNDPSVEQNDSDLGWFEDGKMITSFNEAVYNTKVGKLTMTETAFGYHIIEVTGKKDPVKKVKVAMVDREIYASDNTYQDTFAKASKIATESDNEAEFNDAVAEQKKLNIRKMPAIREMSNYIAGLKSPRQIVRWAYNEDTEVGQVSDVFDLEDMFVVAVLTKKVDEGYPTLDQVKERIEQKVYNQLKGEYFAEKMEKFDGNLDNIKTDMDVTDKHVSPLFFSSRNLPGFTIENEVMGTVFGIGSGTTQPIIGNSGVFVVKINSITVAGDIANYNPVITELVDAFKKRVSQDYPFNSLKESVEIVDNRIEFY